MLGALAGRALCDRLAERLQATVVECTSSTWLSIEGSAPSSTTCRDRSASSPTSTSRRRCGTRSSPWQTCSWSSSWPPRANAVRADTQLSTGISQRDLRAGTHRRRRRSRHRGVNERFSTGLLGGTTEKASPAVPEAMLVSPMEFGPITRPLQPTTGPACAAAMHEAAELATGAAPSAHGSARRQGDAAEQRSSTKPPLSRQHRVETSEVVTRSGYATRPFSRS